MKKWIARGLSISLLFLTNLEALNIKIINKTANDPKKEENFIYIYPEYSRDVKGRLDVLWPTTSAEYKLGDEFDKLSKPIFKFATKPNTEALNFPPNEEALNNPYVEGTSEIEITKGLLRGLNYKITYVCSKGTLRINSKDMTDWSKGLNLPKNATPDEILYKAGKHAGYKYDKQFDVRGSIEGMSKAEFHDLYLKIKKAWSKFPKIWQKIEDSIKVVYKG
jgi:hypothetical protein